MKITDSKGPAQPVGSAAAKPAARNGSSVAGVQGEQIRISPESGRLSALESQLAASPEFDSGKVDAIKQAIRDGKFTINPEKIADKLLSSVEEFLKKPH